MSSIKEMLIYGLGIFVLKGLGFVMMPIVTRMLTQVDYGELNFLVSIASMMSLFLTLGLGDILFRFASGQVKADNDAVMRQCFRLSLLCAMTFLCLALPLSGLIMSWLPVSLRLFDLQLLLISLSLSSLLTVPYCYFRMTHRALPFMFFSVAQGCLQTLLSIGLLISGYGVTGMMLSSAISSSAIAIVVLVYFRSHLQGARATFSLEHYRYIAFIVCSGIFVYCLNGAENWLVVIHLGKQQLAIFFAAGQFGLMISVAFEPFRMWWYARRFKVHEMEPELGAKYAVLGVQIGMLLAGGMLFMAPILMDIMLPESYRESISLIPWMCLIMALRFHSELLNIGCFLKKNARWTSIIDGVCALYLLIMGYWAVGAYGLTGLLNTMGLTVLIRGILFYVISQRLVYLPYCKSHLIISWLIFIVLLIVNITKVTGYRFIEFTILGVNTLLLLYLYRDLWRDLKFTAWRRHIPN
ncbi:oligosaccharide flippase family protein [Moritella sp.]|uniref:lipopolysaccharide biosynthesis protein n=1 Tax=Moritella sp. TaxID=78556 RepID=UPI001DAEE5A3|nr:oligosaccharide flippase family protein [Moritella sp.]MCJ8348797.1 oligosaccharide flippase family protein [Moritella sp.]NQZ38673.1 oligosaccharide flippase family protein [Moritella sp.]